MAWLPKVRLGVIDDARRRQRRRWLLGIALLVAALTGSLVAFEQSTPEGLPTTPAIRPAITVTASSVLAREPYMGVACSAPNSTRCDRIGLAVWLRRPALAVSAEIHGRRFSLRDRSLSTTIHDHRRKDFVGYLWPAGLGSRYNLPARWLGNPNPHPAVGLRIDYGRGPVRETHVRVSLMAGWG